MQPSDQTSRHATGLGCLKPLVSNTLGIGLNEDLLGAIGHGGREQDSLVSN